MSGCSDPYKAGQNGWLQPALVRVAGSILSLEVSRQVIHANDHTGHAHDVTSHRILVNVDDLNTTLNPGATYFAEAKYIVPHEGTMVPSHPD